MDEVLFEHIEQLTAIDEFLDRIARETGCEATRKEVQRFCLFDLKTMIHDAQEAYRKF